MAGLRFARNDNMGVLQKSLIFIEIECPYVFKTLQLRPSNICATVRYIPLIPLQRGNLTEGFPLEGTGAMLLT